MKKIISFLLVVTILVSAAVIPASAKEPVDVYKYLHQHVLAFEEKIDVTDMGFKVSEFQKLAAEFSYYLIYNYADLFYFGGIVGGESLGDEITSFTVAYKYDYEQVEFVRNYAYEHYLSKVQKDWTDLEKVVFIHDQLAVDFQYDVRLFDENEYMNVARDIYGMFTDKQGVCQAYSNTFMYLMQELGIECKLVASDASNHEWNVVKLGKDWYHVDVTQDDPIYTISEDGFSDLAGKIKHEYFLRSDTGIYDKNLDNGAHYDWYYLDGENVTCDSDKFAKDYDFADALTAFVPIGDNWYFLERDGEEVEFEITPDFKKDEDLFQIPAQWATEDGRGYWRGCYTGLYSVGDWLIYNTDKTVSAINVKNKKEMVLYTLDEIKEINTSIPDNNHIFGSKLVDGKIYCQLSNKPDADKFYTVLLDLCGDKHKNVGDWETVKEPTYTEEGLKVKKCQFCGEAVETEIIAKKEHSLVRDASLDEKATCSTPAKKGYKCMNRGCDYVELREDGKAADHDWIIDKENCIDATCGAEGVTAYKCSFGCGETKTEVAKIAEHKWVEDTEKRIEPTEESEGLKFEYCEYGCGETKETVIPVITENDPGDIDGNHSVNASDLALLKKGLASLITVITKFFDCNRDGVVNAADLAILKKFIAGLVSSFF